MHLGRLLCDPAGLAEFYEDGLNSLGALCERTWHDRLHVVAEGKGATLWNVDGALAERELHFPPPESTGLRDADKEVFPGCPLTFRLAEALRPVPMTLEQAVLRPFDQKDRPPAPEVAAKLWHAQFSDCGRWQMTSEFQPWKHFSLMMLLRCEVQAIDQHWSLHRLVVSLPDGNRDESLAADVEFAQIESSVPAGFSWPEIAPTCWETLLRAAVAQEISEHLSAIRERQENYLRRELDRVSRYFENYQQELKERQGRSRQETTKAKLAERLAAAQAEHRRRRQDEIQRHEIRVVPHLDALVLLAEPAWAANVQFVQGHQTLKARAHYVPRSRRWHQQAGEPLHPA